MATASIGSAAWTDQCASWLSFRRVDGGRKCYPSGGPMVGIASQGGERTASGKPELLGRYEVLTQLASGGMAHVYVGRRHGAQGFQRVVAIKRMRSHLLQNSDLTAQFADEAR